MLSNKGNLNADSNYVFLKQLITGILKKRPEWYFMYIFPNNAEWTYKPDGFFNNKQIIRIPTFMPTAKKQQVTHFDTKFFYQTLMNFYSFDLFLNNVVEQTNQIMSMQQTFTKEAMFPIINQHHYIIHSDLPYASVGLGDRGLILSQLTGTVLGTENVFNSLNCKRMIDDNFRSTKFNADYSSRVIPFGFDTKLYETPGVRRDAVTTFVYNHRLQNYKKWRDTFEMFDTLWADGYRFKVLVTSISNKTDELSKKPYVEIGKNLYNHTDYINFIARGHINMTNSMHETFCISAVESMLLGQVLIAPHGATFPEITPPTHAYLFKNKSEQYMLVKNLLDHPDHIPVIGEKLRTFVTEKFSEDAFIDGWISLIEEYAIDAGATEGLKRKEEAQAYLSKIEGKVPVTLMYRRMRDWIGQKQAFTNIKLKRMLNAAGFKDLFENGVQYFTKEE